MSEPMTDERLRKENEFLKSHGSYRLWADEVEKLKMQIAVLRKDNERLKRLAVDFEAEAKVYRIKNGKLLEVEKKGIAYDEKLRTVIELAIERGMIPLYEDIDEALRELAKGALNP